MGFQHVFILPIMPEIEKAKTNQSQRTPGPSELCKTEFRSGSSELWGPFTPTLTVPVPPHCLRLQTYRQQRPTGVSELEYVKVLPLTVCAQLYVLFSCICF